MTDHIPAGRTETLKSVETAITVIEGLRDLDGGRVCEVADHTDLPSSTAYKYLNTLRKHDLVVKESGQYRLGLRFLTFGGYVRNAAVPTDRIWEMLKTIANRTGEMTHFTTEEHGRPVMLYAFRGETGVQTRTNVGQRLYMHQVASGKAILSTMADEEIRAIVDRHGLPKATKNTTTDPEALFTEIERIRETGVAFNREESAKGVHAVGVPLAPDEGTAIGAFTIAGPASRLTGDRLTEELPAALDEAVNELELCLRYGQNPQSATG
ncbi:IclR family transcriptional regulator [Haloplanus litoreus]|uniref:IclR family transcriptional regulator n=2 Tax=Haloplanus litoreus TaxID=767515 RepID=A0ABD6A372_9EURY